MTRTGVTYSEVANIAQQLVASGQEPSIERIRIRLQTGSNSTIGTHLRAWRAKQDPLQQLATREKIPEELIVLLKGLWERVIGQAETQVETIKLEAQQEFAQNKQTIQQLQHDNARLQQSEARLKQACDGSVQENAALEQIIINLRTEIASLKAKHEGTVQQLADKQIRVEELNKQNKQTQANLEHYRAAWLEQRQVEEQRAEQQRRELTQNLVQLKRENESLRQQKIELQQSHNQLELALTGRQAEFFKIEQQIKVVSTDLTEANKLLAQKSELQLHWQTQHDKVNLKWEEQLKITADLRIENAVLAQQSITMKKELDEVLGQNKVLAHDKWILGQEKAQLYGQLKQLETCT